MLRSRLASLLLFLASPAVGGTVLPVAHPCPVDAPWLAQQGTGHEGHAGHHQSPAPQGHTTSHSCTCPSACTVGLGLLAPAAAGTVSFLADPIQIVPAFVELTAPWTPSYLERLPPSTAPPIA
jgi:hypothetical protein